MLAYIFWHRPTRDGDRAAYEAALVGFHRALGRSNCPGLRSSATYRLDSVPWLTEAEGYEDWNLVEGTWALDPLNHVAVTGPMAEPHRSIATPMEEGHGGLYDLIHGEPAAPSDSAVFWLQRPRGIDYRPVLDELAAEAARPVTCWRRRMVLGPGYEFAIVAPPTTRLTAPKGWNMITVQRQVLHPAPPGGAA